MTVSGEAHSSYTISNSWRPFPKNLRTLEKPSSKKFRTSSPPKRNFLRFGLWRILDNKLQLVLRKNMLISDKVPIESKPTYLDIECALYHICWYKNMLQTNWESFYQVFAVFHPSPSRPPKKQKKQHGKFSDPCCYLGFLVCHFSNPQVSAVTRQPFPRTCFFCDRARSQPLGLKKL